MKYDKVKICKLILACFLPILIFAGTVWADQPTKILINVVEDQKDRVNTAFIKSSEIKIGRELIKIGMKACTSDDYSSDSRLDDKEISLALTGKVFALRKAAAVLNAAYIINAKAKTRVNMEEAAGVKLNKAVTTFAYKIIKTATGEIVDMDSPSYISANRSPEVATKRTYDKLTKDITSVIYGRIPIVLNDHEIRKLKKYAASVAGRKQNRPIPKPREKPKPPVDNTITKPDMTRSSIPEIVILNPPVARGFQLVLNEKPLKIEGMAIDPSGITEIRINGQIIKHDAKGRFSHSVELKDGENQFLVMASNKNNKIVEKVFSVNLERDTTPPEVVLTSPRVTRGFILQLEPEVKKTFVEGTVKDDNKISYIRINGREIPFSENGHFRHEVEFLDNGNISIKAEDIFGNLTTKYLKVEKNGVTQSESLPGKKPVLWGLSIGVSKYTSATMNLKYAHQDALLLEKFFNQQVGSSFSEVNFKTLINEEVTREKIIASISDHLGKAAPNDIVFIFVAGHGIKHRQSGSYYFIPSDSDSENILSRGLRMSDFEESIKILSNNVEKIIVAIDSCHSGALQVGMRNIGDSEDLSEAIEAAQGLYIISASKAGELSLESDEFILDPDFNGHGAFTYALVDAMMGKADYDGNKYVSLNEMFQYVSRHVPRLTNGKQHPYFKVDGTDLPFVMIK